MDAGETGEAETVAVTAGTGGETKTGATEEAGTEEAGTTGAAGTKQIA